MKGDIDRWQESLVVEALGVRRAVFLTGARQAGKTTLVENLPLQGVDRRTLDDDLALASAQSDPIGFVTRKTDGTLAIDEIQKACDLLPAIKRIVDCDRRPGQFLLTGSSNLRFAKNVRDSLAGRMKTIRIRTLAEAELNGRPPAFLRSAMRGEFERPRVHAGKAEIVASAFRGGYPEPLRFSPRERRDWYRDYVNDLLLKDIRDITEIRNLGALRQLASLLAAWTGKFFSDSEIATMSGISRPTLQSYVGVLEALYLFEQVPPWTKTDYAKAGKRVKWYACDPGLAPNLLGWSEAEARDDPDRSGKLIETWVHHELSVRADLEGLNVWQYRDADKREIDFLVEDGEGNLLGVEVKAGSTVRPDDFKHLRWFKEKLAPQGFVGIVLHTGDEIVSFGEGMTAVPMVSFFEQ
ncbi:MAG: ATP-binding protein [Kiritimatiellae bacterium]|nr:ATP-binding protein [Kiritimatiellia bacterium]